MVFARFVMFAGISSVVDWRGPFDKLRHVVENLQPRLALTLLLFRGQAPLRALRPPLDLRVPHQPRRHDLQREAADRTHFSRTDFQRRQRHVGIPDNAASAVVSSRPSGR